jgi:DNA-binding CsgD family transcriptional regulator
MCTGAEDSYELLTSREREVLQLVAEGKNNKEIANLLNLSLYTVETHRTHIPQKLSLHSVPELIQYPIGPLGQRGRGAGPFEGNRSCSPLRTPCTSRCLPKRHPC